MKLKKAEIRRRFKPLERIEFGGRTELTPYAGLAVVDALFRAAGLRRRLRACFPERPNGGVYGIWRIVLMLVVHLMLGFRRISHSEFYREDPMVRRVVGLSKLPGERAISRTLASVSEAEEKGFDTLLASMVTEGLERAELGEMTLDFDGSVQSTCGHAEGTAVGFNKKKKGARSYYPLFCTVAETSQFLAMHHRSGNVHDSNGACEFIDHCIDLVEKTAGASRLGARFDSAFFSRDIIETLRAQEVEFSMSVPFFRLLELKGFIEDRKRWRRIDDTSGYFEKQFRPKSWPWTMRFVFVRHKRPVQQSGPLQLDLLKPVSHKYEYQVVVTNSPAPAGELVEFHQGRGGQEKLFGEAKQHAAIDIVAVKRLVANRMVTRAGMLAHNLGRELQMRTRTPEHPAPVRNRTARWRFQALGTIANTIIHRAGRFVRPSGRLTLRLNANEKVENEFRKLLEALRPSE